MLTHVNNANYPQMVDVSEKNISQRMATASGIIVVGKAIMKELIDGDIKTKKGPVFSTAIIAATMAIKKTDEIIPFCHSILLDDIKIDIRPIDLERLEIICTVSCLGKTGVEMEALTGVHIAALTIHDMCKAVNQNIAVENIHLRKKTGGKKKFEKT